MRYLLVSLALSISATAATAGNLATCILDKAPSAKNDHVADLIAAECYKANPGGMAVIVKGSGRGFFGYKSVEECAMKKGQDTPSAKAGYIIHVACNCLYGEPASDKLTC